MKIETKFNEGDTIHFLSNNKACVSFIRSINIQVEQKTTTITYLCSDTDNARINIKVFEWDAFKNKADLLKSL